MVERVVGPGHASDPGKRELDWDQDETTSVTYRPGGIGGRNLPTEEQTTQESGTWPGAGRAPRGIAGTTSNLAVAGALPAAEGTTSGNYSNVHKDNHYAVNKVEERRTVAPGKVKRLSVAVLVDQTLTSAQQTALRKPHGRRRARSGPSLERRPGRPDRSQPDAVRQINSS